jgi:uncharacterized membrane protein
MSEITFIILKIVVIIATTIITYYLVPYLKYKYASTIIGDAVAAMEQTIVDKGMGSIKKQKVIEYTKKVIGNALTEEQIDELIEAAVFAIKNRR